MDIRNAKLITKTNAKDKVIDLKDYLHPSGVDTYAMLHGSGGGQKPIYSTIRITICDYSKGKGDNSVSAYANVAPHVIEQIYEVAKSAIIPATASSSPLISEPAVASLKTSKSQIANIYKLINKANQSNSEIDLGDLLKKIEIVGKSMASAISGVTQESESYGPKFNYVQDRVMPGEDQNGLSWVKKLIITRNGLRKDGSVSRYPWIIKIINGKAKKIIKQNGTCSYDSKTMTDDKEVFIIVSDTDMFRMLSSCQHFITVWENARCLKQVVKGIEAVEQAQEQYLAAKGGN